MSRCVTSVEQLLEKNDLRVVYTAGRSGVDQKPGQSKA